MTRAGFFRALLALAVAPTAAMEPKAGVPVPFVFKRRMSPELAHATEVEVMRLAESLRVGQEVMRAQLEALRALRREVAVVAA